MKKNKLLRNKFTKLREENRFWKDLADIRSEEIQLQEETIDTMEESISTQGETITLQSKNI